MGVVTVEAVRRAYQRRRFHEVGRVLFADEMRWAPARRAYEAALFDPTHPYVQQAEVLRLLVRRDGDVVGRACAHVIPPTKGDEAATRGWFGALEVADDATAMRALVNAAAEWVQDFGATSLAGPATFTLGDEAGVQTAGFEHPGGTGRPWHPPWYAEHLQAAGLQPSPTHLWKRWRLPASPAYAIAEGSNDYQLDDIQPPQAGKLQDPRLVLRGNGGVVAAVPDISARLRLTSLKEARSTSLPAQEASVVRIEGDPVVLIPVLLRAARNADYIAVWTPWSPDGDHAPDTVHQLMTMNL